MANEAVRPARAGLPAKERNRLSIMEAAQDVLREDPGATLDEVAARAGVVRRTLYGHFANRQELVVALVRAAAAEFVAEAGVQCTEPDDVAVEAAGTFLRLWATSRRYGLLIALAHRAAEAEVRAAMAPHDERMLALVEHGQRRGAFTAHLPARVLLDLVKGSASVFLAAAGAGQWTGDEGDVAFSHLLTLGVPEAAAREAVARARTDLAAPPPRPHDVPTSGSGRPVG